MAIQDTDLLLVNRNNQSFRETFENIKDEINANPPTDGQAGHWDRTGTTLSPTNDGDNIVTTGRIGAGTATPDQPLHVSSGGNTSAMIEAGTTSTFGRMFLGDENKFIMGFGSAHPNEPEDIALKSNLGGVSFHTSSTGASQPRVKIDSDGRLLVGTATETTAFPTTVCLTGNSSAANSYPVLQFARANSISNDRFIGDISFGKTDIEGARIRAAGEGTWDDGTSHPSRLEFWTTPSGSATPEVRATIDSEGRLGVGRAPTTHMLEVQHQSLPTVSLWEGTTRTAAFQTSSTGTFVYSYQDRPLRFSVNSATGFTERARIAPTGVFTLGNPGSSGTDPLAVSLHPGTPTSPLVRDSNGRLLVGTATAGSIAKLIVQGYSGSTTGGAYTAFQVGKSAAAGEISGADGDIGVLNFTDNAGLQFGRIACKYTTGVSGTSTPGYLGFYTTPSGSTNPVERMRIESGGATQFYRNTTTATHYLIQGLSDFNGTKTTAFYFKADGGLANYSSNNVVLSDRNVKKDITTAAGTWDCIKEWEIVNYRYKNQSDNSDLNLGVIAQQVAESCPEAVTVFQEAKEATETEPAQEERLGVKEQRMFWMAIKALQEAQLRIEALEAIVVELTKKVA